MNRKILETKIREPHKNKNRPDLLGIQPPESFGKILRFTTTSHPPTQEYLIKMTQKLADDAKSGKLKGIGGFAEYEDGYTFGLEGSYFHNPSTAVLPLVRLQRRVMSQVEEID